MLPALALLFFPQQETNDLERAIRTFSQVYAAVEAHSADGVNPNAAIYEAALPSLLRKLDPHSVFFSPAQFEQLRQMQRSTSRGFGTVVSVLPGRVIILQTVAGAPSAKAGIAPGDEIVAINNVRLDFLDMEQLVGLLGETRQKQAKLDIRRPGNARLMQFILTPEELASPSVDRAFELGDGIGFIRITSFEGETGKQLREAVVKLGGAKLKGLVLDLRNNGGGVINSAFEAAAMFLPSGAKIVSVRGRARQLEDVNVPEKNEPYRFPVAVLINEKTASASEILAGALQDHDRAAILGSTSFGKGLVQSVYPLREGTGIALTTAFYFTPSGRSVQKPLHEGQLEGTPRYANLEAGTTEFKTDSGRKVRGGGGIEPDLRVSPEGQTRLRSVLDASGVLTNFATEFLQKNKADAEFVVTDKLLDDVQFFLSERNIRPGLSEWSTDRDWIRSRVRQEIFNLALGVEKGDEIEFRRDPRVLRAVEALAKP
jgi:carboxyl-terminal processing protease